MNYIIFDLEATCEKNNRNFQNEIIEIGAVKINDNSKVVDIFDKFIKPKNNPILTEFCKELTSITQKDIDNADNFLVVIDEFKKWIGNKPYLLCSWGFYDKKQLKEDCILYNVDSAWINNHISLKHQFAKIYNIKPCGMKKALQILNIPLEGIHHRGIDDAKNIGKIFVKCFNKWEFEN